HAGAAQPDRHLDRAAGEGRRLDSDRARARLPRRHAAARREARPHAVQAARARTSRRLPGRRQDMRRRHALALLGGGLLARDARAQSQNSTRTVVDSARRSITLPSKVDRVFVAGPPASVLAYMLAPEAMVGRVRQPSPAETEFLAAPARDLPETARLTGRGDTVSRERLLATKDHLALYFGSTTQ